MNIQDYWPEDKEVSGNTLESWKQLLTIRRVTAFGFREREQEHGLVPGIVNYNTPLGQDYIRLTFFRVIEEYTEYLLADSLEHSMEELIDSLFFLLGVAVLDDELFKRIPELLSASIIFGTDIPEPNQPMFNADLFALIEKLGSFGDLLRNRSWMTQVQDMYFDKERLLHLLVDVSKIICYTFPSWEEFWKYYIAKDKVLQFRLRSKY